MSGALGKSELSEVRIICFVVHFRKMTTETALFSQLKTQHLMFDKTAKTFKQFADDLLHTKGSLSLIVQELM